MPKGRKRVKPTAATNLILFLLRLFLLLLLLLLSIQKQERTSLLNCGGDGTQAHAGESTYNTIHAITTLQTLWQNVRLLRENEAKEARKKEREKEDKEGCGRQLITGCRNT